MGVEFSLTGTGPPSPGWWKQHRGTDWLRPGEARQEAASPAPPGRLCTPRVHRGSPGALPTGSPPTPLLLAPPLALLPQGRGALGAHGGAVDAGAVEVRLLPLVLLALRGGRGPCEPRAVRGALPEALAGRGAGGGGRGAGHAGGSEAQCLCGPSPLSNWLETHRLNLMSYCYPQALLSSLIFHLNTSPQAAPSTLPNSYMSVLKGKPRGPCAQGAFPGLSLIEPVAQPVCQVPPAPPPVTGPLPAYMPTPLPD